MNNKDDFPLPPLRQDLRLVGGGAGADGAGRGWKIHDPLAQRYFEVDQDAVDLLAAWNGATLASLAERLARRGRAQPRETVAALLQFLEANELLAARPQASFARARTAGRVKPSAWHRLLHGYLFFRVPLARPDRFLRRTLPAVAFMFSPAFWWAVAALGLLGLYLLSRQWESFLANQLGHLGAIASLSVASPVVEAVGHLDALHSTPGLQTTAPVLAAVNGVDGLHGITLGREGDLAADGRLGRVLDAAATALDALGGDESSSTSSLRLPATADGVAGVVFDLQWRSNRGWLQVMELGSAREGRVAALRATLADGRPLPAWIRVVDRSTLVLDRPVESVTVKITLVFEDGSMRQELLTLGTGRPLTQGGAGLPEPPLLAQDAPLDFAAQLDLASRGAADRQLLAALGAPH